MRHQTRPSSGTDFPSAGQQWLVALIFAVGLTVAGVSLLALACYWLVPDLQHTPEFNARYTVLPFYFYAGQPAKTAAYQAGLVAVPVLLGLGLWWGRRWAAKLSDPATRRAIQAGVAAYFLLVLWSASPLFYCPHPPFASVPPHWLLLPFDVAAPVFTPERIFLLIAATGIGLVLARWQARRRAAAWTLGILLTAWVILIPVHFYAASEINDSSAFTYHLNSLLDAFSQSVNGHHLLVDFPHIYGGYEELLAPVAGLFPRRIETLIAALAIPPLLSILCLLCTARLVIRQPILLFLCGLGLLATQCLGTKYDEGYAYQTARAVFPPIGLLAATLYFRRPNLLRYATVTLVAAVAPIWNLDTGLVLWASWLLTLLVQAAVARDLPRAARHLAAQIAALAIVWAGFFLYLRLASGRWPEIGLLFYFQEFVVNSGYFCVSLLVPDAWIFVVLTYLIGLAVAGGECFSGRVDASTWTKLMVSLLGLGIFSYFMGRSVEMNLVAVIYPVLLLAGILCGEGAVLARRGRLPAPGRLFLLPFQAALFWWAFLFAAELPDLLAKGANVMRDWKDERPTPLRTNIAFVTQEVRPGEKGVFFLSNQSGIYYYLSDTVRPLPIPGMIELFKSSDMDQLVAAIRARRLPKLFVEQNFYDLVMYRPDIYQTVRDAVAQNYRVDKIAPTGRLILYTPR